METVIAIDPGSEKTGIAVVTAPNRLCEKSIVPTADADAMVADYLTRYSVRVIVIGDGTRRGVPLHNGVHFLSETSH